MLCGCFSGFDQWNKLVLMFGFLFLWRMFMLSPVSGDGKVLGDGTRS